MTAFDDLIDMRSDPKFGAPEEGAAPLFDDIVDLRGDRNSLTDTVNSSSFLSALRGVNVDAPTAAPEEDPELAAQLDFLAQGQQKPGGVPSPVVAGVDIDVPQVDAEGNLIEIPRAEEEALEEEKSTGFDILDDMSAFFQKADHKVKVAGESVIMSAGAIIDFIGAFNEWTKIDALNVESWADLDLRINDVPIEREDVRTILENEYLKLKEFAGGSKELESLDEPGDFATALLAANVTPGAALGKARLALREVGRAAEGLVPTIATKFDDVMGFAGIEAKFATVGALAGTTAAGITEGPLPEKEKAAHLWNAIGMAGLMISPVIATVRGVVSAARASRNKLLTDSDEMFEATEQALFAGLSKMVPAEMLPEVMGRMKLVREMQAVFPNYKPTVGNIIGTEESMALQRLTDAKNMDLASERFFATEAAVKKLTKLMTTDTDPANKAKLAKAISMFAGDQKAFLETSRIRMTQIAQDLRHVSDDSFTFSGSGEVLRSELTKVQKVYRKVRDDLYAKIDPEGTVRFNPAALQSKVDSLVRGNNPLQRIAAEDAGYSYVTQTLPAILKEMSKRSTSKGTSSLNQSLGFTPREKPYLTFNDVNGIYRQLGARASNIARENPSSGVPGVLKSIQQELLATMDNQMGQNVDPKLAGRYKNARDFMTNEYYSRFKDSTGGKLTAQVKGGDAAIPLDKIGETFWKSGREVPMEDFNKLFRQFAKQVGKEDKEVLEASEMIARDAMSDHAMKTLSQAMDGAKDPLKAIQAWKKKFEGSLKNFPEVRKQVDELEINTRISQSDIATLSVKEAEIDTNIIRRFGHNDPDRLMNDLYKMTPSEAESFMVDILRGANATSVEAGLRGTLDVALRHSFIRNLVGRAYSSEKGGPDWKNLDGIMNNKRELITKILEPDDIKNLNDFGAVLKLLGKANRPSAAPDLDTIGRIMKDYNVNPGSIVSRYYAMQMGKVSRKFLMIDMGTRYFQGARVKHFDKVLRSAMYDLDGLEKILRHAGADDTLREVSAFREILKKSLAGFKTLGQEGARKLIGAHVQSMGFKIDASTERLRELNEEPEKESFAGEGTKAFLLMNDHLTGQPSRINPALEDEEVNLIPKEEEKAPEIGSEAVLGDVTEASDIPGIFSSAEAGEAFAVEGNKATLVGNEVISLMKTNPVIQEEFNRMGISTEEEMQNIAQFMNVVVEVESSSEVDAKNPTTSAKGLFQFVDDTTKWIAGSYKNSLERQGEEIPEWVGTAIKSGDIRDVPLNEQLAMTLRLWGRGEGSDDLMKKAASGDTDAMKEVYKKFHHTNADAATKARLEILMATKLGDLDFFDTAGITQDEAVKASPFITKATLLPGITSPTGEANVSSVSISEEEAGKAQSLTEERRKGFTIPEAKLNQLPPALLKKLEVFTDEELEDLFS